MKLRCIQNSIRLRLRKSDINALATAGIIREEVWFPGGEGFTFSLAISNQNPKVSVHFETSDLRVLLPENMAKAWIDSNQVGIERYIDLPFNKSHLHVLIEKDFPCKDRVNEDKADTFTELADPSC